MIIVEGPDCAGKTTLINQIIKPQLFDWDIKMTEGPGKSEDEMRERIIRYSKLSRDTICDRHPIISEMIYAPVCNREIFLPDDLPTEQMLGNVELIIICLPEFKTLKENYRANHQPSPTDTPDHLRNVDNSTAALHGAYQEVMGVLNSLGQFPIVHYSMDKPNTMMWVKGFVHALRVDREERELRQGMI